MNLFIRSCAAWLIALLFCVSAYGALRVEVVDDTDHAHSPYLLLVAKSITQNSTTYPVSVNDGTGALALAIADATNLVEATATATISGGQVTGISLSSGGSNYQAEGTIPVQLTGGTSGTPATAEATVSGGIVTAVTVTSGGSGYNTEPAVNIYESIIPKRIDMLEDSGNTVVSPYTGKTRPIRYFEMSSVGSGAFMVFYNDGSGESPFTYTNNVNPSPNTANFRFDQCEITFNANIQSGANLTSIDALSMPMQFEQFTGTAPALTQIDERKYYASLDTFLRHAPAQMQDAFYKLGSSAPETGWLLTDSFSTFARALGPGQVAANSNTGDPSPYPSFLPYVQNLATLNPTSEASGTATIGPVGVSKVAISNNGSGYSQGTPPTVTLSGGGGTGATATATVSADGKVVDVTITNAGSGYTSAPTISFGSPGSGAAADVFIGANVTGVSITDGGTGYTTAPAVTFIAADSDGNPNIVTGSGAKAIATISGGSVDSVIITKPRSNLNGHGYTKPPHVVFSQFNITGTSNSVDYTYAGNVKAVATGYAAILTGSTLNTNTLSKFAGGTNSEGTAIPIEADVTANLPTNLSQATATATVDGSGTVTGITVTDGGNSYIAPPTVTVAAPASGTQATATATLNSSGAVTSISIGTAGTGYDSANPPVVTINKPVGSLDTFIYGAALNADSFSVAGMTPAQVGEDTNIVYGSIARDVLAALNFGFINGNYGNTSDQWYNQIPADYPFGKARPDFDGFYNPWAALIYNYSDAYGFAFSDRINPSPLITLEDTQTLRITLLPDVWLDPPAPHVSEATSSSLTIEWDAIEPKAGYTVTGYRIDVLDPQGTSPITPTAPTTGERWSHTLSGLESGQPYTLTVTALGTYDSNSVSSTSFPVHTSTTGSVVSKASGNVQFGMNISFTPPPILLSGESSGNYLTAEIDGHVLYYNSDINQWTNAIPPATGANATVWGSLGDNVYPVTIKNKDGDIIFKTNAEINISSTTGTISTDASYYENGTISIAGSGSGTVMSLVLPPNDPSKEFSPVVYPGKSYAEWIATFSGLSPTGGTDDPDSDQSENLLEYFHSTDPAVATAPTHTISKSGNYLLLSYHRSKDIKGTTEVVEWSTDLSNWQSTGVTHDPDKDYADYMVRTARIPLNGNDTLFVHLRVTVQ